MTSKRIVPAILTDKKQEFRAMLALAQQMTDYIQVDIMDGSLTGTQSLLPREFYHEVWGELTFEAHIMAMKEESSRIIESLKSFGQCKRIIVHKEACQDLEELRQLLNQIRDIGKQVGVALNPETDIREIGKVVKKIDQVLFMGVNPGQYGAEFQPEVLDKVRQFQERYTLSPAELAWDGGVSEKTLPEINAVGVSAFCVGSALFGASDPVKAYRDLEALIQ